MAGAFCGCAALWRATPGPPQRDGARRQKHGGQRGEAENDEREHIETYHVGIAPVRKVEFQKRAEAVRAGAVVGHQNPVERPRKQPRPHGAHAARRARAEKPVRRQVPHKEHHGPRQAEPQQRAGNGDAQKRLPGAYRHGQKRKQQQRLDGKIEKRFVPVERVWQRQLAQKHRQQEKAEAKDDAHRRRSKPASVRMDAADGEQEQKRCKIERQAYARLSPGKTGRKRQPRQKKRHKHDANAEPDAGRRDEEPAAVCVHTAHAEQQQQRGERRKKARRADGLFRHTVKGQDAWQQRDGRGQKQAGQHNKKPAERMLRAEVADGAAEQRRAKEDVLRKAVVAGKPAVFSGQLFRCARLGVDAGREQLVLRDLQHLTDGAQQCNIGVAQARFP